MGSIEGLQTNSFDDWCVGWPGIIRELSRPVGSEDSVLGRPVRDMARFDFCYLVAFP
jgi:hypothetical protein